MFNFIINNLDIMPRKRRHSGDDIYSKPSLPKLRKIASDSKIVTRLDPYQEINHYEGKIQRFSTNYYVTEFILEQAISYPEEKLKEIFDELIDAAYKKSNISGSQVEIFSMLIFGKGIDTPVAIPARNRLQNNADVIMNEIDKLKISDKYIMLLSNPMKIIITTISPPKGNGQNRKTVKFLENNEKGIIKIINTDDNCLYYAAEMARIYAECSVKSVKNKFSSLYRILKNKSTQEKMVKKLLDELKIESNQNGSGIKEISHLQDFYDKKYPSKYRIILFNAESLFLKPIWKGPKSRLHNLILYLEANHYDVIKRVPLFFNLKRKYCIECEIPYSHDKFHRKDCLSRCYMCSSVSNFSPCQAEKDFEMKCENCNRIYLNSDCFEKHKSQVCNLYKLCELCGRIFQYTKEKKHICGEIFCKNCGVVHNRKRGCFIKPVNPKLKKAYRIIAYDFETTQDIEAYSGIFEHIVNFCSARVICTKCIDNYEDNCEICLNDRHKTWSDVEGIDPLEEFTKWVLKGFNDKYKTLIYAHYGGKFDHHFILQRLYKLKLAPTRLLMSGCKIYEFTVKAGKAYSSITFRDSYLLMTVKLKDLKKTFNLKTENKLYFPHLFNKRENYKKYLDKLPSIENYMPGSMNPNERKDFIKWYLENQNTSFFLPNQLKEYCSNDSEILLEAIIEMRKILLNITGGFDVMENSATIAGISMNIFKSMFLPKNLIALVPEGGYERNDRASVISLKYFDWLTYKQGMKIKHAGNGGEVRIGKYKLDGFIEKDNKAIEFLGCNFHGCLTCYKPGDVSVNGRTMKENNETTMIRINELRKTLKVDCKWECEIYKELKYDKEMSKFFADLGNEKGPIDPRNAYFGGRTGPLSLYAKSDDYDTISWFDIVSLYPFINFSTSYPVGIPDIIIPNDTNVHWTSAEQITYNGLLKVRIIPPRNLLLPVIPIRCDKRMLFALCFRCAKDFEKKNTKTYHKCSHTDEERAFTTTITSIELKEAIQQKYVVTKFYRAWHYKIFSSNLFKEYVRRFIKLKVEASGFPMDVITDEEMDIFIKDYANKLEVFIEKNKVSINSGLRHIVKLLLNALWGKFSMRNTLAKSEIITDPSEYFKLVFDIKKEISMILPMSDTTMRVVYKDKKEYIEEHNSSNIVISLWTTSAARLVLYNYMKDVITTPGCKMLYTDTDSIIFTHPRGVEPIKDGQFLGEMMRELGDFEIDEFCSGGAKQLGMKLINKKTGEIKTILKLRGITLDHQSCQQFQYDEFKDMVLNFGRNQEPMEFKYFKINPQRDSRIFSKNLIKKYIPVCQKGIIDDNLQVFPFGYEDVNNRIESKNN